MLTTGGDTDAAVGMLAVGATFGAVTTGEDLLGFVFVGVVAVREAGLFCCCCSCCLHFALLFLNHTWNKNSLLGIYESNV